MDSKSGTPWVNLSGQDSMCHSCTAGSTGAEQFWGRLCEMEVYILGEGLCSTMHCSWHLIFQQRSTMSQMCVDLPWSLISLYHFGCSSKCLLSWVTRCRPSNIGAIISYNLRSLRGEPPPELLQSVPSPCGLEAIGHIFYSLKGLQRILHLHTIYIYIDHISIKFIEPPMLRACLQSIGWDAQKKHRKPVPVMSGMLFPAWSKQLFKYIVIISTVIQREQQQ